VSRTRWGIALIVAGVVLALVSVSADALFRDAAAGGFGWKQIAGVIVGVAAASAGVTIMARDRRSVSYLRRRP
jgi:hypothetical protein